MRDQWRDGKGLHTWLMQFGDESDIVTQERLRRSFENASLPASADMVKLQTHCDNLLSIWCRIDGNDPAKDTSSYVWRVLTSMPSGRDGGAMVGWGGRASAFYPGFRPGRMY